MDSHDNVSSKQVGVRLPGHLYRWLKEKVDSGEYPNMASLLSANWQKPGCLRSYDSGRPRTTTSTRTNPLSGWWTERIEGLRRDLLDEVMRRKRAWLSAQQHLAPLDTNSSHRRIFQYLLLLMVLGYYQQILKYNHDL